MTDLTAPTSFEDEDPELAAARERASGDTDTSTMAYKAMSRAQQMRPGLQAFARALTGDPDLILKIWGGPASCTNGEEIRISPPMQLGLDVRHDRSRCNTYDETGMQLCAGCAASERVLRSAEHEIGHITQGTFIKGEKRQLSWLLKDAAEWLRDRAEENDFTPVLDGYDDHAGAPIYRARTVDEWRKEISNAIRRAPNPTMVYVNCAMALSPFLKPLWNGLEDARVNAGIHRARPGSRRYFEAGYRDLLENGILLPDGTHLEYRDRDPESQLVMAACFAAMGYDLVYEDYFSPEIVEVLQDPDVQSILARARSAPSMVDTLTLARDLLEAYQGHGYMSSQPPPAPASSEEAPTSPNGLPPVSEPKDSEQSDEDDESQQTSNQTTEEGPTDENAPAQADQDEGEAAPTDADDFTDPDGSDPDGDDSGMGEPDEETSDDPTAGPSEGEDDRADNGAIDEADSGAEDADLGDDAEGDGEGDGGSAPDDDAGPGGDNDHGNEGQDNDDATEQSGAGEADDGPSPAGDDGASATSADDDDEDRRGAEADADAGESGEESSAAADGDPDTEGEGASSDQAKDKCAGDGDDEDDSPFGTGTGLGDGTGSGYGLGEAEGPEADLDEEFPAPAPERTPDEIEQLARRAQADLEVATGHPSEDTDYSDPMNLDWLDSDDEPDPEMPDPEANFTSDDYSDSWGEGSDEMEVAHTQHEFFRAPSSEIGGVNILRLTEPGRQEEAWDRPSVRNTRDMWNQLHGDPNFGEHIWRFEHLAGIQNQDQLDALVQRNLNQARLVFTENQAIRRQRNLPHGRLASNAGPKLKTGNDKVFGRKTTPDTRDYAVLIGLDVSGSTANGILIEMKQAAYAQAELLHRLGIKFAFYCHTSADSRFVKYGSDLELIEIKAFDEPWNDECRRRLEAAMSSGGNIDGHTLQTYRRLVEREQATDRLILYYTDGAMPLENYEEELEILKYECKLIDRTPNLNVLAVGAQTDSPEAHGLETVRLDSPDDLPKVVEALKKKLL